MSKDKEWARQSKTLGRFIRELPYVTAWPKYGRDGGFVFRRLSEIDRISPHLMSAVHHVDSQMLGRSGPAIARLRKKLKEEISPSTGTTSTLRTKTEALSVLLNSSKLEAAVSARWGRASSRRQGCLRRGCRRSP